MKTLLLAATALIVAGAPLASAVAQPYGEVRRDRRELQDDRRELRQDYRDAARDGRIDRGEARELRRDQREVNDSRRDLNDSRRDRFDRNNRGSWQNRAEWRGFNGARSGYWFAPGYGYQRVGPGYRAFRRGERLPAAYRNYAVQDPYFYGLRPAPRGYRWVYNNNNFLLTALATGLISDVVINGY